MIMIWSSCTPSSNKCLRKSVFKRKDLPERRNPVMILIRPLPLERISPSRCIICPHWLLAEMPHVMMAQDTSVWGFQRCISVVHSKTTILICYLLDYQQVHDNVNVSIILLGDKKEPTKWKTNPVQQILLPNNHFPCYFYFKNHFYWRKEKRCVTCLWLPTKANTQI